MEWKGNQNDCRAYLDSGLYIRITRIDPPREEAFYVWTIHDPFVRVPVASSCHYADEHPSTLEEAKCQATKAAEHVKKWV